MNINSYLKNSGNIIKIVGAWLIIINASFLILSYSAISGYPSKEATPQEPATQEYFAKLKNVVLPPEGYEINIPWNDIGPKLISGKVIDSEKFKTIYADQGGLGAEELEILEKGSSSKIKITSQNSHFVLNMLWAFGLAQQNSLLTAGDMIKYGDYKKFASTGGWTISSGRIEEFYSKFNWLNLTSAQENQIKNIAENVYRPCCNNSTAFPDCNHGMAALGLIEIMVAGGSSEQEIYNALKYFNSFWFESSYLETAIYFDKIKNISWENADAKEILSFQYSSSSGWSKNIHAELAKYPELLPQQSGGGGCGV